jgi:hypothetical protein
MDSADETQPSACFLTIRDSTGKTVDGFMLDETEDEWSVAQLLFAAARRKALRVDEALATIINELDTKRSVGLARAPKQPRDDDIPF